MPHIHEKIDFCAEVFIVHKDKVLLRMHDKFKIWLSIGGHIELDEDPVEAAIREVKEEVGLDIKIVGDNSGPQDEGFRSIIPPRYLLRHSINQNHEHIAFVYFAMAPSDSIYQSMNEHERTETKWVTKEELAEMELVSNVRFYAMKALEALGK